MWGYSQGKTTRHTVVEKLRCNDVLLRKLSLYIIQRAEESRSNVYFLYLRPTRDKSLYLNIKLLLRKEDTFFFF